MQKPVECGSIKHCDNDVHEILEGIFMIFFVINAGSSSLKSQLIEMETRSVLAEINCERIGIDGRIKYKFPDGRKLALETALPDHMTTFKKVIELVTTGSTKVLNSIADIKAVGHRIVFGGMELVKSVLADDKVIATIDKYAEYAPLHNPAEANTVRACIDMFGKDVPQVCVFDTSFHQTMPMAHAIYGIPYEYYKKYAVRKMGFHGISHQYVANRAAQLLGKDIKDTKIVTCHIGNGASICAVDGGKSIDISMGFGTCDGILMGTRCGMIDPLALFYIAQKEKMSVADLNTLVNKKSGLQGVSGISSDSRELEEAELAGNERAKLANDIQRYHVKKLIGSYAFEMGGLDAVVFTAGIGERSPMLRAGACAGLERFGIKLDPVLNEKMNGKEANISAPDAKVPIYIIPTNEELQIAFEIEKVAFGK